MTKRVWVFRHAESLANAGGKTLEPEGIPLTENGHRQARDLAWGLAEAPHRLVTSPFRRAIETGDFLERLPAFSAAPSGVYLEPGTNVGPYRLLRELGTGGTASVWLAERVDGPDATN